MKRILLLVLFANMAFAGAVYAQCTNTSSFGSATAPAVGNSVTIATNQWATEYATISSVVSTATYISASSNASDYITIRQGTFNGPVIAHGTTPLTWTATVTGNYYQHINTNASCGTNTSNRTTSISRPLEYGTNWISMNTGSSEWCAGETRTVSVTVRNNGTQTWTDGSGTSDFNIGIKWNADADYFVRVDAGNLASGATQTYNLTVTAPTTVGSNNLSFDVVREACFWFANNGTGCGSTAGPGNVVYTSPAINIKPLPTSVSAGTDVTICAGESTSLNGSATSSSISGSTSFTYSGSGDDCDNFRIGGITSGMPVGATITSIVFNATIGTNCTSWYEWDLMVNNTYIASGCNGTGFVYNGLNGASANGQTLQLRSWDNDFWCDFVTMTASFTVNYLSPPSPVTYTWGPTTGLSNPNIANPVTSPTSTTTYTMTATANGCSATDDVLVFVNGSATPPLATVTLPSAPGTYTSSCDINDANWHYFYDSNGNLLAGVQNTVSQNLGTVDVTITVGDYGPFGSGLPPGICGTPSASPGEYVMPRYWDINVTNQPTNPVNVVFYYTNTDVNGLVSLLNTQTSDYLGCWGDVNVESDLMMTVDHGSSTELFTSLSQGSGPNVGVGQRQIQFSLNEFSGGKLHSNGGVSPSNVLPVELTLLTAQAVENEFIQLYWATATEINNSGFNIERSLDGENFEKIDWVDGHGNTTEVQNYTLKDPEVSNGIYYYRLKQIDFDGQFEYSDVVSASIQKLDNSNIVLIPNPATNNVRISSDVLPQSISIINILGQEVLHRDMKNNSSLEFDISDLETGIYMVTLNFGASSEVRRLLVE
jgi:hypothetical protein